LLVLDNFEQVIGASPLVAELLSASPRLKILVTTRAVLHLRGEQEFPVPPLTVPSLDFASSTEALALYSAVALFVERALAVKPDFALTEENARAIAEICLRLDGLPLAIELAAARVKLLSPQAMLPRMEHRLKLLTGGAADLPARQQTMRSTIGWSYDLLDQCEREVFARLSVFMNGCSLEAIDAICDASSIAEIDLFDTLGSLVDKSLIQQRELRNGEPRSRCWGRSMNTQTRSWWPVASRNDSPPARRVLYEVGRESRAGTNCRDAGRLVRTA